MPPYESMTALWSWPLSWGRLYGDMIETLMSARAVIDARMPMIAAAWTNPFSADHAEMSRMVTEKVSTFGRSQRTVAQAAARITKTADANSRTLGRLSAGSWISLAEWAALFERNLEAAATLALLPAAYLAPIHERTAANARRLSRDYRCGA